MAKGGESGQGRDRQEPSEIKTCERFHNLSPFVKNTNERKRRPLPGLPRKVRGLFYHGGGGRQPYYLLVRDSWPK